MSVFRSEEANGTLAAPPSTTSNRKRIMVKGKDKIKKENRIKKQEERKGKIMSSTWVMLRGKVRGNNTCKLTLSSFRINYSA